MRRFFVLVGLFILVTVIFFGFSSFNAIPSSAASTSQQGSQLHAPLLAPSATPGVQVNATPLPASINVSSLPSPRVLAFSPDTAQLNWYATGQTPITIALGSTGKALMTVCGSPTSDDIAIVYEGGTVAQPFLMPLTSGSPLPLGSNVGMVCLLRGHMQFSPDHARLGFIKYNLSIGDQGGYQAYATGPLSILKLPDVSQQTSIDNVTSFDLQNDGVVAVQFFTNAKNQVKNTAVVFWDGTKLHQIEENVQLLNTDSKADCAFLTATALRVADKVYVLYGEKCKLGGSTWRLRRADLAGGNGQDVISGPTGLNGNASDFITDDTSDMILMPSGKDLLVLVPNGQASNIADVARVSLADSKVNTVQTGVVVDTYPRSRDNSPFQLSPKGDQLAMITSTPDGTEQLMVYDMTAPDKPPVAVTGGAKQDRITGLAWAADDQRLFFNFIGDSQAMFAYSVTTGSPKLIVRGTFQSLALNADGSQAATNEQIKAGPSDLRYNLVTVKTDDGTKTNVFVGGKGGQALNLLLVH